MKKLATNITLLVLISLLTIQANAEGLTRIHEDYKAAMEAAKKENKLLLIDFYTTWCGPCKVLSKEFFNNDEYAAQLGEHFVLLKYDAERDSTFHITKKHHVTSYPTAVILNNEGYALAKKTGYQMSEGTVDIDDYMSFLNKAVKMEKSGKHLPGVSNKVDLDFPQFYIDRVNKVKRDDYAEELKKYWAGVKESDYMNEVPFAVMVFFGATPEVQEYFQNNLAKYRKLYGETDVNNMTYAILNRDFREALKEKDEEKLEQIKTRAISYLGKKDAEYINNYYTRELWKANGNWAAIVNYAEENKKELNSTGNMNDICWNIFEKCDDIAVIKRAAALMKTYNEQNPTWATVDTYANLLYKSGDVENAITQMEKAIALGKKEDVDVSSSEEALKKFKDAK